MSALPLLGMTADETGGVLAFCGPRKLAGLAIAALIVWR